MASLHIISTSPYSSGITDQAINILSDEDTVLLIGDGCYGLSYSPLQKLNQAVYVLSEDAKARGVGITQEASAIDYNEFVELCAQHQPIVTW